MGSDSQIRTEDGVRAVKRGRLITGERHPRPPHHPDGIQQVEIVACHDGVTWSARSPQCPGMTVVEHSVWRLRQQILEALRSYFAGRPFKVSEWRWE